MYMHCIYIYGIYTYINVYKGDIYVYICVNVEYLCIYMYLYRGCVCL